MRTIRRRTARRMQQSRQQPYHETDLPLEAELSPEDFERLLRGEGPYPPDDPAPHFDTAMRTIDIVADKLQAQAQQSAALTPDQCKDMAAQLGVAITAMCKGMVLVPSGLLIFKRYVDERLKQLELEERYP